MDDDQNYSCVPVDSPRKSPYRNAAKQTHRRALFSESDRKASAYRCNASRFRVASDDRNTEWLHASTGRPSNGSMRVDCVCACPIALCRSHRKCRAQLSNGKSCLLYADNNHSMPQKGRAQVTVRLRPTLVRVRQFQNIFDLFIRDELGTRDLYEKSCNSFNEAQNPFLPKGSHL
jgi:hypothetical protein